MGGYWPEGGVSEGRRKGLGYAQPGPDQKHPGFQTRAHVAAILILDGGYRVSEVLGLPFEHCDFDNLVVRVRGKGNKHRLVPLSMHFLVNPRVPAVFSC